MQYIVQILFLRKMDFITTIKISVSICFIQLINYKIKISITGGESV